MAQPGNHANVHPPSRGDRRRASRSARDMGAWPRASPSRVSLGVVRTPVTDPDVRFTRPEQARPPLASPTLDRRALLRAAGLSTVLLALGACGADEAEPPS